VTTRKAVRAALPAILSRLPDVRGRGRVTLLLDRVLTDEREPQSFQTVGQLNGGFPFAFDLRPWGQKFAYYYRCWEADLVRALKGLYRGGWFIDVGSSLGLYVVCMSDRVRAQGGRIASIEPVPFNLDRQMQNIALNGIGDLVDCVSIALGAEAGSVRLSVDPLGADNNAIVTPDGAISVEMMTLDRLCSTREWKGIGAIKMDVEGYEPKVIAGGRDVIARERPPILAEFNRERMAINGFSMEEPWDFLRAQGYEAYRLESGRLRRIESPQRFENLFFVPKEVAMR
jgi:FkbM family methyltransferase